MKERISVPDHDVPGWIQILREGGFTDQEIDSMLSNLNVTYREIKEGELVNKELGKMDEEIRNRRGTGLTEDEKELLRKGIESRFK